MIVLVCGGRTYSDRDAVFEELDLLHHERRIDVIVHGGAAGADALASEWAKARWVSEQHYPADWATHGNAAGPIRNAQMLREGTPDLVLAFPGGRGTADMIRQAQAAGVHVQEIP